MPPLVTIIIINYNTKHLLKGCIESLFNQTCTNKEMILIDNNSGDGSCEFVQQHFPDVMAVCNKENIGYAPAGNQGITMAKGKYVMLMNPDIFFEKDYLEKCIAVMEGTSEIAKNVQTEHQKIAAICGKIKKYDFERHQKTNFIDTVGLFCYRNRRVIDDGQGLEDKGQFDTPKEVFGISGACPLYRKEALEDVKIGGRHNTPNEYLDNDFFMYKEDVDLSWRFLLFGWKNFYLPSAVAYHGRGTGVLKRFTHLEVLKNRRKLTPFQKYYSYKNQRLMQVKNELWMNFLHDFFHILWKEFLIFGYILFREPYLLKSWFKLLAQIPKAFKKRRIIMKRRRVDSKYMKRWLSQKQSAYYHKS